MLGAYNSTLPKRIFQYIKELFQKVENSDEKNRKIIIYKYEMVDTGSDDINELRAQGLSYYMTMRLYYKITHEDGRLIKSSYTTLLLPKLVNNLFIIEGKYRLPTNELTNDSTILINSNKLIVNDDLDISYNLDEPGYGLMVNAYDDDGEKITFPLTDENYLKYIELFKLNQVEKYKIQIKLNIDDAKDYLTPDMVIALIKLGPDIRKDNIIDKSITTIEESLLRLLNRRSIKRSIISNIRWKFLREEDVYLTDFQTRIDRFFKVADESSIDIPTTINPMVFDTLKYKIALPRQAAYTKSMIDVIDMVNTPINNNVNRLNELNVCIVVKEGVIYIKCYKYPTGEKIMLPYLEYLNKSVLCNENWNYDTNEVVPYDDGKVIVKLRQRDLRNTIDTFAVDLIEPKPDEKLSPSTRQIPMINMSDTVRLSMATSMEKQAIPIQDSEDRLVATGHEGIDFEDSILYVRYTGDVPGKVTAINLDKGQIFIEDELGSVTFIDIPTPLPGMNSSAIVSKCIVKVGDTVLPDQIVAAPQSLDKGKLKLGKNTLVAYMDYLGYSHEDSIIVSETYADSMKHFGLIYVTQNIYKDDIIRFIRNIGSKVTSQEVLINVDTKARIKNETKELFKPGDKGILQGLNYTYDPKNLVVPNNCDEAYVIGVDIDVDVSQLTSVDSKKTLADYNKDYRLEEYDWLPEEFKHVKPTPTTPPSTSIGTITFSLATVRRVKPGDKLCNSYGSKGIVGLIVPDHLMPRLDLDGKGNGPIVDLIMNPPGVISRKNPSQIYECALTNCISKIYELANDLLEKSDYSSLRKLLHKYYGNKYDKFTDVELRVNHAKGLQGYRMIVGSFSKLNYQSVKQWMEELNVDDKSYVYIPDVVIVQNRNDMKSRVMSPDEYVAQPGDIARKYEMGFTEQPVIFGYEYMLKLYHAADYVGKVTSSIMDNYHPVMGKGSYKGEGQRIGEMEFWEFLAYGVEEFVQSRNPYNVDNQYQFLNEWLSAGYTIVDKKGIPVNSGYVNQLEKLAEIGKLGKLK